MLLNWRISQSGMKLTRVQCYTLMLCLCRVRLNLLHWVVSVAVQVIFTLPWHLPVMKHKRTVANIFKSKTPVMWPNFDIDFSTFRGYLSLKHKYIIFFYLHWEMKGQWSRVNHWEALHASQNLHMTSVLSFPNANKKVYICTSILNYCHWNMSLQCWSVAHFSSRTKLFWRAEYLIHLLLCVSVKTLFLLKAQLKW